MKTKIVIVNLAALLLFAIDRWLKNFFINNPDYDWGCLSFKFNFIRNTGVAWGIKLSESLIIIFSLSIILIIFFYLLKKYYHKEKENTFILTILLLGAVSNIIDRFLYGGVIDYLDLNFWPVFNLADIMITFGGFGIIIKTFLNKKTLS